MSYDFDNQQQGMSGGMKFAIGCGAFGFVCMVLICGGMLFMANKLVDQAGKVVGQVIEEMEKHVEGYAARFEALGYQRVNGQVVNVTTEVTDPTVYTVQVLQLNADSQASVAVIAQAAEINGNIDGDLNFYGQSLTIGPDVVITGNLHIEMAQVVNNSGTVEGEVFRSETPFDGMIPEEAVESETDPDAKPAPGDVIDAKPAEPDETPDDESPDATPPPAPAAEEAPAETEEAASPPL